MRGGGKKGKGNACPPCRQAAAVAAPLSRLDQAAFGRFRPNADNAIDSKSSARALREKPDSTFSQRAL